MRVTLTSDSQPAPGWGRRAATTLLRLLALLMSLAAARYFFVPVPGLKPVLPEALRQIPLLEATTHIAPYLYAERRALLLIHIAGGILALALGPFQFVASIRANRPALHRVLGFSYLIGIAAAATSAVPLAFMFLSPTPEPLRPSFYPSVVAFLALSATSVAIGTAALVRARQRQFEEHRRWMIRSYSLTFAAVTARLWGPLLAVVTTDGLVLANAGVVLWPVNLLFAQGLIQRFRLPSAPRGNTAG